MKALSRVVVIAAFAADCQAAMAASASDLARDANARLAQLTAGVPAAKALAANAHAILVFPTVTKAGLGVAAA